MRKLLLCLVSLGMLSSMAGCVRSELFISVRQAEAKVAEAEKAGVATAAPYEFEASKQWLALAKHEADEFDSAGQNYAKKAIEMAEAAIAKAKGGGK